MATAAQAVKTRRFTQAVQMPGSNLARRSVQEMLELVFDPMPSHTEVDRARGVINKLSDVERTMVTRLVVEREELSVVAASFSLDERLVRKITRGARIKLSECNGVTKLCLVADLARRMGY